MCEKLHWWSEVCSLKFVRTCKLMVGFVCYLLGGWRWLKGSWKINCLM